MAPDSAATRVPEQAESMAPNTPGSGDKSVRGSREIDPREVHSRPFVEAGRTSFRSDGDSEAVSSETEGVSGRAVESVKENAGFDGNPAGDGDRATGGASVQDSESTPVQSAGEEDVSMKAEAQPGQTSTDSLPGEAQVGDRGPAMPFSEEQLLRLRAHVLRSFEERILVRFLAQGREVSMKLEPPQFGSMNVRLRVEDGVATARFVVGREEVREAIASGFQSLQEALREHGIEMKGIEVLVENHDRRFGYRNPESGDREQRSHGEGPREAESYAAAAPSGPGGHIDRQHVDYLI